MIPRQILLMLTIAFVVSSCHFKNKQADLILHNATIYSVDDAFSTYEAIAIKDGKILALGTEREILNEYDAPQIIDCGKQFIYPGFIDGHCHFLGYGRTLQEVNLDSTASFAEVIERVKEFKPTNPYVAVLTILSAVRGLEFWQQHRKNISNQVLEDDMVNHLLKGIIN